MFEIDVVSQLLTTGTDESLAALEKKLSHEGYTLGYFVPPDNGILLEEALSRRAPNLYSTQYGELSDLCVALALETLQEKGMKTKIVPRQATGPSWKNLVLGNGHHLGLIYEAILKIFPRPSVTKHSVLSFASLEELYKFERQMIQRELKPLLFGRMDSSVVLQIGSRHAGGRRDKREKYFLALEWSGSSSYVTASLAELERLAGKKYPHHGVDSVLLQRSLAKLLREKYPDVRWGEGLLKYSDSHALRLEKVLLEAWKGI